MYYILYTIYCILYTVYYILYLGTGTHLDNTVESNVLQSFAHFGPMGKIWISLNCSRTNVCKLWVFLIFFSILLVWPGLLLSLIIPFYLFPPPHTYSILSCLYCTHGILFLWSLHFFPNTHACWTYLKCTTFTEKSIIFEGF